MTSTESLTPRTESEPRSRQDQVPLLPSTPTWGDRFSSIASRYALIAVWGVMALTYFILLPDTFGQVSTFQSIFGSQQVLVVLVLAALSTLVVGEFDLSFASVMGISAVVLVVLVDQQGMNIAISCVIAMLAALGCGVFNAFFVVRLGVPALVVTLGSGTLFIGIAALVSDSSLVAVDSPGFSKLAVYEILGMPVSFYYGLGLAVLFAYVCGWTPLGRHLLFVGANPEVARLAGIRVNRIRAGSYVVASLFAGFAGLVLVSSVGGYDPSSSGVFLLPTLAAAFLGTAVVLPGRFNPIGALIGIYFLQTGIFGLQLLGYTGWIQDVFYGGGLVAAVAIATVVRQRSRTAGA